ncbi:ABC transporter ATP-binding protein [symbiont of Argiope bruennichi]|uniref:ABC transporter ATP-binding protein n=1 Tax=symbiont of Argiope bruennichi TaxID=2810479 RepID=UPI003DA20D00
MEDNKEKKIVLEVNNLSKSFKTFVLNDISFKLYENDCLGLIGPNGSGKTTLIYSILNIYKQSKKSVIFHSIDKKNIFKDVGVQFQENFFNPNMKVIDVLKIFSYRFDVDFNFVLKLVRFMKLTSRLRFIAGKLSGGERQKLGLILALINKPKLLVLDEITSNVDPLSRQDILEFLSFYRKIQKNSMIVVSHYLEELQKICNRYIFLKKGKIIFDGTLDKLRNLIIPKEHQNKNISLETLYEIIYRDEIEIRTNFFANKQLFNEIEKSFLENE